MSSAVIVTGNSEIRITTDSGSTSLRQACPSSLIGTSTMTNFMFNGTIGVAIGYDNDATRNVCLITTSNPVDSNSWTVRTNHPFNSTTNRPYAMGWNGSYWIMYSCAVSAFIPGSYAGKISKSTNGIDWTVISDIGGFNIINSSIKRIIWSGSFWIAGLSPSASTNNVFLKSTDDGVTWSFFANTNVTSINDIEYNGSYFLATGTVASTLTPTYIIKSTDCITWTPVSITLPTPHHFIYKIYDPVWNGSYWIASTHTGSAGLIKGDATGTSWTVVSNFSTHQLMSGESLTWDGLKWVAFSGGSFYYSSNGVSWVNNPTSYGGVHGIANILPPLIRLIVTAPGTPTGITVVAGENSAVVSWTAPASDGNSPITGYIITPSVGSPVTVGNVLTATVTGLESGTGVTFTVVAINSAGSSSTSPVSPPVIPIPASTVAGAPTNVLATAGTNSATVSWTAPTSNGGAVITGYTVTPSIGLPITVGNVLTATLTGLASIYSITFRVYAINSVGSSLASEPSLAITPNPTTVGPPSSVLGVTGIAGVASATINWTAPVSNGGSPITGYKVICVPDNKKPNTAGPTANSLVITGLKNAINTVFTVVALNAAGQSDSVALTSYPLPGAPKVVAVRGASGVINLTWTAKAAHVGSPITGYVVSLVSPLPASQSMVIPTPLVTATGGSASISGLTNGAACVFSVKSVSNIGQSATSGLSKALIPAGPPDAPTAVVGTKGLLSAQLTWLAPVNTGGLPITGYIISYTVAEVVKILKLKVLTTTIIKGLVNGTAYTFTIQATTLVGNSVASSPVTVTPGTGA